MEREGDCSDINKRGAIYDHRPSAEISIDSQMVKRALTWLAASQGIRCFITPNNSYKSSLSIIQLISEVKVYSKVQRFFLNLVYRIRD
ncbi:uncharacterized protein TNCV_2172111 [Trichonephila clavipes]|nr:uncharacterized protein TNCV_2172111 [Trichonephila clavipes]